MTDLAASNLTYTINSRQFIGGKAGFRVDAQISFGNGSLTYPSGGVPITKAKLACPRRIRSLDVIETNAVGYLFTYDVSAEKLFIHLSKPTGTVAAPTISLGNAAGNVVANATIGLNALANGASLVGSGGPWVNVVGVQAPAFTGTEAAFGQATASSFAPAATVLQVVVVGY